MTHRNDSTPCARRLTSPERASFGKKLLLAWGDKLDIDDLMWVTLCSKGHKLSVSPRQIRDINWDQLLKDSLASPPAHLYASCSSCDCSSSVMYQIPMQSINACIEQLDPEQIILFDHTFSWILGRHHEGVLYFLGRAKEQPI